MISFCKMISCNYRFPKSFKLNSSKHSCNKIINKIHSKLIIQKIYQIAVENIEVNLYLKKKKKEETLNLLKFNNKIDIFKKTIWASLALKSTNISKKYLRFKALTVWMNNNYSATILIIVFLWVITTIKIILIHKFNSIYYKTQLFSYKKMY